MNEINPNIEDLATQAIKSHNRSLLKQKIITIAAPLATAVVVIVGVVWVLKKVDEDAVTEEN